MLMRHLIVMMFFVHPNATLCVPPAPPHSKCEACAKHVTHKKRARDQHADEGTCSKQLTTEQILQGTAWAWFTLPKELFMWSFVSVGYVTREDMARMNGMSVDILEAH